MFQELLTLFCGNAASKSALQVHIRWQGCSIRQAMSKWWQGRRLPHRAFLSTKQLVEWL